MEHSESEGLEPNGIRIFDLENLMELILKAIKSCDLRKGKLVICAGENLRFSAIGKACGSGSTIY